MAMLRKLIAGSDATKTRLHDQRGVRVSGSRLIRNGPAAVLSGVARVAFDARPAIPWISYDATRVLARRLGPAARVLEFGSGMSTVWYAAHAAEVVSIEHHAPWFAKVGAMLSARGLGNVRYRLAAVDDYARVAPAEQGDGFDLVMVDGIHRDRCVELATRVLRPGGMIYLDNADRSHADTLGDARAAREALLAFAAKTGATVEWFTDFAPAQFFVQAGLLVTTPGGQSPRG